MSLFPSLLESSKNSDLTKLYAKYDIPILEEYKMLAKHNRSKMKKLSPLQSIARSVLDMLSGNGVKVRYIIINLKFAEKLYEDINTIPEEFEWVKIVFDPEALTEISMML